MKPFLRTVHLWTGLVFGTILVLQGLTGAALSWVHELDAMLNPGLLQVAPPPAMRGGDPLRLPPVQVQAVHDVLAARRALRQARHADAARARRRRVCGLVPPGKGDSRRGSRR